MKSIIRATGRAIKDFNLIEEGDVIAIGISGGKDSMLLAKVLAHLKRVSPVKFDLIAITVDLGLSDMDLGPIGAFCDALDIPHKIVPSDIGKIVFDIRQEKNPCSLCANLRRGAVNSHAKALGANKVALGHHREDAIETLMMSMLSEGRVSCFKPKTYLDRVDITVIRPFIYVKEESIITETKDYPIVKSTCPACNNTSRQKMKELLVEIEKEYPMTKHHLLLSLMNVKTENLWVKEEKKCPQNSHKPKKP